MKTWNVTIPISGSITVEVEAETEKEAKRKALDGDVVGEFPDRPDEWECHEKIVKGNVCYASQWEIEAEEAD